jgi:hypothetical protein
MRNLIQVIIVFAFLVIGGSFILVAIARFRMVAQRGMCTNYLRIHGSSLELYYETNPSYPSGTVQNSNLPPEERLSWLVTIWPFIQAEPPLGVNKSESWNSNSNYPPFVEFNDKTNEPAHTVGLMWLFQCPSNPQPPGPCDASVNHYIGVAGVGRNAASLPFGAPGIGFFGYDRKPKKSDITDGTSNTIAVMETLRDAGPWTAGGPPTVRGLSDPAETPYFGDDAQWTTKHHWVQALFVDGSIRNMRGTISPVVLEALATIAGNEDVLPP